MDPLLCSNFFFLLSSPSISFRLQDGHISGPRYSIGDVSVDLLPIGAMLVVACGAVADYQQVACRHSPLHSHMVFPGGTTSPSPPQSNERFSPGAGDEHHDEHPKIGRSHFLCSDENHSSCRRIPGRGEQGHRAGKEMRRPSLEQSLVSDKRLQVSDKIQQLHTTIIAPINRLRTALRKMKIYFTQ